MSEIRKIISKDTLRSNRLPPGQYEIKDWPVLHYGKVPRVDLEKWDFRIFGLVKKEMTLNYQEFLILPQVEVYADFHCVEQWSRLGNLWQGVSSTTISSLAEPLPEARYVIIHCENDFTTILPLEDFLKEDVLFAYKHDQQTLKPEHGCPLRLVVPQLYFWKSAKWVRSVEFTDKDRPGFWEQRGYHDHGDIWLEERFR
ncbi:MAG: Protein-methionine-sulfoxide reductase catalytic subunit MsrP [candidate division WS2 bacterium]|nr:Protein-methionine-sulfoxide reductase catalytic subunit MsrP [Candidatus Psychracetigena formicireducens]